MTRRTILGYLVVAAAVSALFALWSVFIPGAIA